MDSLLPVSQGESNVVATRHLFAGSGEESAPRLLQADRSVPCSGQTKVLVLFSHEEPPLHQTSLVF